MVDVNADQRVFWTETVGKDWIDFEAALEEQHGRFIPPLFEAADLAPGQRVLDVGCGTGETTRRAAEIVGPDGRVTGLDISAVLLARARALGSPKGAAQVAYVEADAQVHGFEAGAFDRVVSRMGVMFFDDPGAAFANLRKAVAPGGRFAAICWRRGEDSKWFGIGSEVVTEIMGPQESPDPLAPGPMAFADGERVVGLLSKAGWAEAAFKKIPVTLSTEGGAERMAEVMCNVGPAVRKLREAAGDAALMARFREAFVRKLGAYESRGRVEIPVVMNVFTARAE